MCLPSSVKWCLLLVMSPWGRVKLHIFPPHLLCRPVGRQTCCDCSLSSGGVIVFMRNCSCRSLSLCITDERYCIHIYKVLMMAALPSVGAQCRTYAHDTNGGNGGGCLVVSCVLCTHSNCNTAVIYFILRCALM